LTEEDVGKAIQVYHQTCHECMAGKPCGCSL